MMQSIKSSCCLYDWIASWHYSKKMLGMMELKQKNPFVFNNYLI